MSPLLASLGYLLWGAVLACLLCGLLYGAVALAEANDRRRARARRYRHLRALERAQVRSDHRHLIRGIVPPQRKADQ